MTMRFSNILLCASVITASVLSTGCNACSKAEPSRWEPAAKSAEAKKEAPPSDKPASDRPKPSIASGGTLNKFFPPENVDGKKRTFTAEKLGYVEAKVSADGKEVAMLSISDFNAKISVKKGALVKAGKKKFVRLA